MAIAFDHPLRSIVWLTLGAVLVGLILTFRKFLARFDPEEPNDLPPTVGVLIGLVVVLVFLMLFEP